MPKGPPEMGMGKGPMSMGKDGKDGKGGKGQVPWGLGMLIFFL